MLPTLVLLLVLLLSYWRNVFYENLYGNFTLRMNHADVCSHYKPRCRLHALYIWVVLYICAFESVTDTLFHLRGETMRLPLIQFSIFRVLSETVTETNTQQSLWQILSTVCVVCLQQRQRGNKKQTGVCSTFPSLFLLLHAIAAEMNLSHYVSVAS